MNNFEKKMVDTLTDLKENYFVSGIKAEFEAEGTRLEEALRLKDVCSAAGIPLTIKIGGCEALRDMYECRVIGVNRIVAPMIESAYALKKFIASTKLAYPVEERDQVVFLANIETLTAFNNFDEMLSLPEIDSLGGIVFGRHDFGGSIGVQGDDFNSDEILSYVKIILAKAKAKNKKMQTVVGGGVSANALPFLRSIEPGMLDRYETRKVIFDCPDALNEKASDGILKAVGFELLWLKNKQNFYSAISMEDNQRIITLEARYKHSIASIGGKYE